MDVESSLSELGLSSNEAKVYLLLLRKGSLSATQITKETRINRRSVYDLLESLIGSGLVSFVVLDNKKEFLASGLDSILASLEEKKKIVDELKPQVAKLVSEISDEPNVSVFSGKKAMKGVFEGLLNSTSPILIYGGAIPARLFIPTYYPQWTKRREERGIKIKGIFTDLPEVRALVKKLPLVEAKFIPKESLSPAFWWLQENTVYLVFFQETSTIIKVQSESLAKTYLNSFNLMWKSI